MNRILFVLLIFSGVAFSQTSDIELKDLKGDYHALTELKGKNLTVLDFWATWCQPCMRSLPAIQKIHDTYNDRGVQLIGLNQDGPRNLSKVEPFVRSMGITYPVLLDLNGELAADYQVTGIPTIIILDSNDRIVWVHQGYIPGDEKILTQQLDALLAQTED